MLRRIRAMWWKHAMRASQNEVSNIMSIKRIIIDILRRNYAHIRYAMYSQTFWFENDVEFSL